MPSFRDICCDICLDHVEIFIAYSDKSSEFNSFACTVVALDFHVFGGTNFFIDEWRQYISRVFIFTFLIQLAKFVKIKTLRKFLIIQ